MLFLLGKIRALSQKNCLECKQNYLFLSDEPKGSEPFRNATDISQTSRKKREENN